jgi:hypothetical protein
MHQIATSELANYLKYLNFKERLAIVGHLSSAEGALAKAETKHPRGQAAHCPVVWKGFHL